MIRCELALLQRSLSGRQQSVLVAAPRQRPSQPLVCSSLLAQKRSLSLRTDKRSAAYRLRMAPCLWRPIRPVLRSPLSARSVGLSSFTTRYALTCGRQDSKVHVYMVVGGTGLNERTAIELKGTGSVVAYSPDGKFLATGDSGRAVLVLDADSLEKKQTGWLFHSARITSLSWTSDSKHIASGSIDTNIFVWSLEKPTERIVFKGALRSVVAVTESAHDLHCRCPPRRCDLRPMDHGH
jgi:hypothetical protein